MSVAEWRSGRIHFSTAAAVVKGLFGRSPVPPCQACKLKDCIGWMSHPANHKSCCLGCERCGNRVWWMEHKQELILTQCSPSVCQLTPCSSRAKEELKSKTNRVSQRLLNVEIRSLLFPSSSLLSNPQFCFQPDERVQHRDGCVLT